MLEMGVVGGGGCGTGFDNIDFDIAKEPACHGFETSSFFNRETDFGGSCPRSDNVPGFLGGKRDGGLIIENNINSATVQNGFEVILEAIVVTGAVLFEVGEDLLGDCGSDGHEVILPVESTLVW